MLKKEVMDTGKLFATVLLTAILIQVIAFSGMGFFNNMTIPFAEMFAITIEIALLLLALVVGSGLFAEEKAQNSFEYLFSLRLTRVQILLNKLIPRLVFIVVGVLVYLLLLALINAGQLLMPSGMFLIIYFTLFFASISLSLLHRNNMLNMISSISLLVVIWGFILFILNFLFNSFTEYTYSQLLLRFRLGGAALAITLIVSVLLFVSFVLHFRKVDLNNLYTLFFKRYLFRALVMLLGLFLIYVVINQFDAAENPNALTMKDLRPATFDKSNGFYRLHSLLEPPDVDVESPEVFLKYRRYHDPQYNNDQYVKNFKRLSFAPFSAKKWDYFPAGYDTRFWAGEILKKREKIISSKKYWALLLQRYQKLLDTEVFGDFTRLHHDSPIPNLLGWLRVAKLYLAMNMLDALEGNWQQGVANILDHIRFQKRAIRGSRVVVTNLVGKAILKFSLQSLSSLMSHPDCPKKVHQQVIDGLTPIQWEEFGTKNCWIGEYLVMKQYLTEGIYQRYRRVNERVLVKLFYQKNRTLRYIDRWIDTLIKMEKTPPHRLEKGVEFEAGKDEGNLLSGWFWWLTNPVGKLVLMKEVVPNYMSVYMKSYHVKCIYDMTRIAAQFYQAYDGTQPPVDVLKGLPLYRQLLDPCSGKPYIFNQKKQILYGIGTDLDDDGGKGEPITSLDTDFVLPLRLKG